jgi:hypothetical protein
MNRAHDPQGHRFRTDRVFNADGRWYFQTREGIDVGPYPSKETASAEAARLARLHRRATRTTHA